MAFVQVGLGVAVEYALGQGMPQIWERIHSLGAHLRSKLQEQLPLISLHDRGRRLCGIVSFTLVCPYSTVIIIFACFQCCCLSLCAESEPAICAAQILIASLCWVWASGSASYQLRITFRMVINEQTENHFS